MDKQKQTSAFTFRISKEELAALERHSSEEGLSVSELLRQSASLRPLRSILVRPQIDMTISMPALTMGERHTWTENRAAIQSLTVTTTGSVQVTSRAS